MKLTIKNNYQLTGYALLLAFLLASILTLKTYFLWIKFGKPSNSSWIDISSAFYANYMLWAMFTPLMKWVANRYLLGRGDNYFKTCQLLLLSIIISTVHEFTTYFVWFIPLDLLGIEEFGPSSWEYISKNGPPSVITRMIEFWIIYLAFRALKYYKDYQHQHIEIANIKSELSLARLSALKAQLQPHFLFNTLNSISSLIDENPKLGQKVLSQLGTLLRTILEHETGNLITLSEEMNYIKSYLAIEQVRFSDRLVISYQLDADTLNALVPQLILQPIVENAIKHGFSRNKDGGQIIVSSQIGQENILITVWDNGSGASSIKQTTTHQHGIGLQNVAERLLQIYGKEASMTIEAQPNQFFSITLSIPQNHGKKQ